LESGANAEAKRFACCSELGALGHGLDGAGLTEDGFASRHLNLILATFAADFFRHQPHSSGAGLCIAKQKNRSTTSFTAFSPTSHPVRER